MAIILYWTTQGWSMSRKFCHVLDSMLSALHPLMYVIFKKSLMNRTYPWGRDAVVLVESLSHVQLFATPWTAACQTPLFSTISWSLLKFMSMESVRLPNHLILCYPLFLLPFLASRVFSNELALCIRLSKYWSSSISPFNEYSGLLSSRIDWFDLLAVQGTLNNLIQHHNSKASILQHSTFFMDQLSHTYMITGKVMDYTDHKYIL